MTSPGENLRINGDRLWESLMDMAKVGPGVAGGNNRQTLTDADKEGLTEEKAIALMLAQPSMIKRPVLEAKGKLTVGFKPDEYKKLFG